MCDTHFRGADELKSRLLCVRRARVQQARGGPVDAHHALRGTDVETLLTN